MNCRPSPRKPDLPKWPAGHFSGSTLPAAPGTLATLLAFVAMRSVRAAIHVGTAGWSIAAPWRSRFAGEGSQLERYGGQLNAVEINSSFYRPHQEKTYRRWAESVPLDFRFAVKLPKTITHERRLADSTELLARFRDEVLGLGEKLGVILVQLPPGLAFSPAIAAPFFEAAHAAFSCGIACEPRHRSWFTTPADRFLADCHVARVAADPPRAPEDGYPGGWKGLQYWRLHGSPAIYYSSYDETALAGVTKQIEISEGDRWCIFDNTAAFSALGNALALRDLVNKDASA